MFDAIMLARMQFAFSMSFHILFPALSIGLVTFICLVEGLWLKTNDLIYYRLARFFTKVFALTFGMGVVSGIVMEYQLGTNWSGFTEQVGGVLGSLFTYEVMTAFFVEAGSLGVMLFGWKKVGPKLHFFSTIMVALGTTISAYWIMCANTWMQHPVGYTIMDGHLAVSSWLKILTNPLLASRFLHMLLASYVSACLVIAAIAGLYLLRQVHLEFAKKAFSLAWLCLTLLIPAQIIVGDLNGAEVFKYQPMKTAAIEGIWESGNGQDLLLFAIPDQAQQTNKYPIRIPKFASFINTHDWNGYMPGLKSIPRAEQPHVSTVFWTFRIMVGLGLAILFAAAISVLLRMRKTLYTNQHFLKLSLLISPFGLLAMETGWVTSEVGRQPWTVYNLVKTADSVSFVTKEHVLISFALIIIVYGIIFGWFYTRFLRRIVINGPRPLAELDIFDQPFQYMSAAIDHKQEQ